MAKGRPRKSGKRTASGRLSRAGKGQTVPPSDWVKAQHDRFGEHYNSALGRAFVAGLLGHGQEAKDRYQWAKKFARAYDKLINRDLYRCALDRSPRGGNVVSIDPDRLEWELQEQQWLFAAIDKIDATGCRTFFDQLISTAHTDRGPYWLDNLIDGGSHKADTAVLDCALKGIDAIVPKQVRRILYG